MLSIKTTRFGEMELDKKRVIRFPEGLLGFPEIKDYTILEHKENSPFLWLQAVEKPDLAFLVINPLLIKKDFLEDLSPSEKDLFSANEEGKVAIFVLVTIPAGKVEQMTVNLLGPILIDAENRIGKQVILANSNYPHQYPLISS